MRRYFDIVLFDEASQVLPEDAVPAVLRAQHAVVAGDSRQLPPTTFFASVDDDEVEMDEAGAAEGFESVLDLMSGFADAWSLDWHYRSHDEALIAFSNRHIYGDRLITFPGIGERGAVSHVLVPQLPGVDGQEDSVDREVDKVVDLVVQHARERPSETLGVIAMGIKHARRIQSKLDQVFDPSRKERFFVKNLERVQGDERDAIILSIGYGKDRAGKLPYRFGPLLTQGGERRLNVAVSRARERLTLVSSFNHHDMDPERSRARGVQLLRSYLEYASSGGRILGDHGLTPVPLNEFEQDVYDALCARGMNLLPQWGTSRYRIDLVAQHPSKPGRLVLAIECDGASYHSAPTARDRDRLRQEHLQALGWRFLRIWSTDWFMRKSEEVERALQAYADAVAWADRDGDARRPRSESSGPLIEMPATAAVAVHPRAPRPAVPRRQTIEEYPRRELEELVRWVCSDGRLRTDEELVWQIVQELGFSKRGSRIVDAIEQAIAQTRRDADRGTRRP